MIHGDRLANREIRSADNHALDPDAPEINRLRTDACDDSAIWLEWYDDCDGIDTLWVDPIVRGTGQGVADVALRSGSAVSYRSARETDDDAEDRGAVESRRRVAGGSVSGHG